MRRTHLKGLRTCLQSELLTLLPWRPIGRSLKVESIIQLLSWMCCLKSSLHAVLSRCGCVCSENTLRIGLRRQLPECSVLATRFSQRLVSLIDHQPRRGFRIAIDTHWMAYYGQKKTAGMVRGQLKASTRKFFIYSTACVVQRGCRYTLALSAVESNRPIAALQPLLQQLRQSGIRIRSLVLDKAFFAAEVFAALQKARIRYIVAVPSHRREIKRFWRGRRESTATYRITARSDARLQVAIGLRRLRGHRRRIEVYAVGGLKLSDHQIRRTYRSRFGIESSYRQLRQVKPPTTSRDRAWRLLLVGLALLLRQLWVAMQAMNAHDYNASPMTLAKLSWDLGQNLINTLGQQLKPRSKNDLQ